MDVLEAIKSRRSIFRFKPEAVANEVIERIFAYGTWAPNHHLTEPWHFVVLGAETKEKLAQRYREIQMGKAPDHVDDENRRKLGEAGYAKFHSKPTIVAVACLQDGDETKNQEDYAATCCAMQNIQLAAWNEGIGMQWSTGPITKEDETYELLGIDKDTEYIIGFLYTGYPEEVGNQKRKPVEEVLQYTP